MKKYLLYAAALLMTTMTACQTKTDEEILADYEAQVTALSDGFNAEYQAVATDSTLTDEQKDEMVQAIYAKTITKLVDDARAIIKKYPSKSVAVSALKNIATEVEADELEELLGSLKGEAAEDEFVTEVKNSLAAKKATAEGQMFTDFTVVQDENDPEGSTVKFSDFVGKGKYVLVDFWASWCGPCKAEIPNIAAVYEKYKGDDFDVLSIAVWDKPADTKASAVEHGVVWSQIINAQRIPTEIYGIDGIPHIMLIGPDGTILKRNLRGDNIEAAVAEALGR